MMVLGFHGTAKDSLGQIKKNSFRSDLNRRPKWLGSGVYFFQDGYGHASAWARFIAEKRGGGPIVIKATISLKDCIDLSDNSHWAFLRAFIEAFPYPGEKRQLGLDSVYKDLSDSEKNMIGWNYEDDFYVSGFFRSMSEKRTARSIRASFVEGRPIFRRSWLFDQSHLCICVKDPSVILNMMSLSCKIFIIQHRLDISRRRGSDCPGVCRRSLDAIMVASPSSRAASA